jgi:GT2 family glycosyltransferase
MTRANVAVVVMTRNRVDALRQTLRSIDSQTVPSESIIVVDGGSGDGTAELVGRDFPAVHVLRFEENIGPAAGRSIGMRYAFEHGCDMVWLVDDDSTPRPNALGRLLRAESLLAGAGIIGVRSGRIEHGLIRHDPPPAHVPQRDDPPVIRAVDFVLLDGALVGRSAAEIAGYPREDFFIMMEDVEYPLRVAKHGLGIYELREPLIDSDHLGSRPDDPTTIWRGYYQARNHIRMAIDLRMPMVLVGAALRELRFCMLYLGRPDGQQRLRFRWRGIRDAFANRMGRTIDPEIPSIAA